MTKPKKKKKKKLKKRSTVNTRIEPRAAAHANARETVHTRPEGKERCAPRPETARATSSVGKVMASVFRDANRIPF